MFEFAPCLAAGLRTNASNVAPLRTRPGVQVPSRGFLATDSLMEWLPKLPIDKTMPHVTLVCVTSYDLF